MEACTAVPEADGEVLLAFGFGSTSRRECIAQIRLTSAPQVTLRHFQPFCRGLHEETAFSGSENIEGALWIDGRLRLFNRGNGASCAGIEPVNATVDLAWEELAGFLLNPVTNARPRLQDLTQYDLGDLAGQRLTFTDATRIPEGVLDSAAAEDSPNAVCDGAVAGSALGLMDANEAHWIEVRTPEGKLFAGKVEGVYALLEHRDRVYLVIDADDPQQPSELCEAELRGF